MTRVRVRLVKGKLLSWQATLAVGVLLLCLPSACLSARTGASGAREAALESAPTAPVLKFDDGVRAPEQLEAELPAACRFDRIEVTTEGGLLVDGESVGALSAGSTTVQLVEPLWARFGGCFPGTLVEEGFRPREVELPSDIGLVPALSVLETLLHAGYSAFRFAGTEVAPPLRLRLMPASLATGAALPVPAERAALPEELKQGRVSSVFDVRRPKSVLFVRAARSGWEFVWASQAKESPILHRLLLPRAQPREELAQKLAAACARPELNCSQLVLEAPQEVRWAQAFEPLALLPEAKEAPLVELAFLDEAVSARTRAAEALGLQVEVGTLDPALAWKKIEGVFPEVGRCYQAALERKPGLKGRIVMRFVIELDGRVSDVSDVRRGTLSSPAVLGVKRGQQARPYTGVITDDTLVACIRPSFERLTFPRPEGGEITVLYTLDLRH